MGLECFFNVAYLVMLLIFFMTLASGHYFIFQTGLMPASLIINLALIVISLESDFDVEKQIF